MGDGFRKQIYTQWLIIGTLIGYKNNRKKYNIIGTKVILVMHHQRIHFIARSGPPFRTSGKDKGRQRREHQYNLFHNDLLYVLCLFLSSKLVWFPHSYL